MSKREKARATDRPTNEQRVTWLLSFLRNDVATLTSKELLEEAEHVALHILDSNKSVTVDVADDDSSHLNYAEPLEEGPRPNLQALHDSLRAGILALHAGQPWSPWQPPLRVTIKWESRLRRYYEGPLLQVEVAAATDLLVEFWPRIRRCPYEPCGVFFLKGHGNNKYHDPQCSNSNRQRRHAPKRRKRDYKEELVRKHERHPTKEVPKHSVHLNFKRALRNK